MRRLATLLFTLTFSPSLFAEEIRIPVGQQGQPEMAMPAPWRFQDQGPGPFRARR